MIERRLVAVLGYSRRRTAALHPICAGRLEHAAREAGPGDAVLLSGRGEAEAMARSWAGPSARLVLDARARSTLGNAVAVARAARDLEVQEVVLVTSRWHGRRAAALVGAALGGSGVTCRLAGVGGPRPRIAPLRELACWLLVPLQARLAARARPLD